MLEEANLIMFWVPRNMETMPGLTTNVEFGLYLKTGKIIYGRPDNSERNNYLDELYKSVYREFPTNTLESTIESSLKRAQEQQDYLLNRA